MTSHPLAQSRSLQVDHRVEHHGSDVRLDHPGETLAAIPHMLGFHPIESLVVLGLCGRATNTVGVVLRVDLPPPPLASMAADQLLVPLLRHKAVGVLLAVVGARGPDPDDDLPHRDLLAQCEARFVDSGMPIVHQLWLPRTSAGLRWRCYDVADCTGLLPEPDETPAAAAVASRGLTTYGRREDIAASLLPDPPDVLDRRAAALDRFSVATEPGSSPPDPIEPDGPVDEGAHHLAVVRRALSDAAEPAPPDLAESDVIRLIQALSDHRVRDMCLDFDGVPSVVGAERLWAALVRAAPEPERAEPASLLAFSAYARGDGVLAAMALDKARSADPGHRLTELLCDAVGMGVPAARVREAGIEAARSARGELVGVNPL